VVPAVTLTGVENTNVCQPDAVSFENVPWANSCPELDHNEPTCVPVFVEAL
jgi:hypothetical protein